MNLTAIAALFYRPPAMPDPHFGWGAEAVGVGKLAELAWQAVYFQGFRDGFTAGVVAFLAAVAAAAVAGRIKGAPDGTR